MKPRRPLLSNDAAISIAEIECDDHSPAQIDLALRALARLFVRDFRSSGDPVANVAPHSPSSRLTVARDPSPHRCDDAA